MAATVARVGGTMHEQPMTAPSAAASTAKPFSKNTHHDEIVLTGNSDRSNPDVRTLEMMLREALTDLGQVRSEVAELRRQHALVAKRRDRHGDDGHAPAFDWDEWERITKA